MTPDELRAARAKLGLTASRLALALRLGKGGDRTVRRWEHGERAIPGPVQVAIEMMAQGRDGDHMNAARHVIHFQAGNGERFSLDWAQLERACASVSIDVEVPTVEMAPGASIRAFTDPSYVASLDDEEHHIRPYPSGPARVTVQLELEAIQIRHERA